MSQKVKWFKSVFDENLNKNTTENDDGIKMEKIPRKNKMNVEEDELDTTFISNFSLLDGNTENTQLQMKLLSSTSWLDLFEPKTITDLIINPKKLTQLQNWFTQYEKYRQHHLPLSSSTVGQILLLSGPSGCGKTITLKLMAKSLNYELLEWINPIDIETFSSKFDGNDFPQYESQIIIFKRFLFRSSRYKSLINDNNNINNNDKKLILIKDFPNVLIRNPDEFHTILSDYMNYGKTPLVFIVTDSKYRNINLFRTLFPDHIKQQFNIADIAFNPMPATLMKKALKRINDKLKSEYLKIDKNNKNLIIQSDDVLDNINLTSQGDIRNAILNLQLISMKGTTKLREKVVNKSVNNKRQKNKKYSSLGQDEILTTMHAIGRIIYPKYNLNSSQKSLLHSPEKITEQFSIEIKTFLNLIYANYLTNFKCVEDVSDTIDNLSLSDLIINNEYKIENSINNCGLNLAIRGVMIGNKTYLSGGGGGNGSGWNSIRGCYKQNDCNKSSVDDKYRLDNNITKNIFSTDYAPYLRIIRKN